MLRRETGRYRLEVRIRHAPDRLFGRADDEVELLIRAGGAWERGASPAAVDGRAARA